MSSDDSSSSSSKEAPALEGDALEKFVDNVLSRREGFWVDNSRENARGSTLQLAAIAGKFQFFTAGAAGAPATITNAYNTVAETDLGDELKKVSAARKLSPIGKINAELELVGAKNVSEKLANYAKVSNKKTMDNRIPILLVLLRREFVVLGYYVRRLTDIPRDSTLESLFATKNAAEITETWARALTEDEAVPEYVKLVAKALLADRENMLTRIKNAIGTPEEEGDNTLDNLIGIINNPSTQPEAIVKQWDAIDNQIVQLLASFIPDYLSYIPGINKLVEEANRKLEEITQRVKEAKARQEDERKEVQEKTQELARPENVQRRFYDALLLEPDTWPPNYPNYVATVTVTKGGAVQTITTRAIRRETYIKTDKLSYVYVAFLDQPPNGFPVTSTGQAPGALGGARIQFRTEDQEFVTALAIANDQADGDVAYTVGDNGNVVVRYSNNRILRIAYYTL